MFDTARFLNDHYRDADAVIGLLGAYGLPVPNRDTARKWISRASVPSEWFPVLVAAAELEAGRPLRLAQYIREGV